MNRREFLYSSLALTGFPFLVKSEIKLCFNTLACPDWDLPTILKSAKKYGYNGVELRCYKEERDLFNHRDFREDNLPNMKRLAEDLELQIVVLNSSSHMHFRDGNERRQHLEDAKRYIDLAAKLKVPFVRVFPEKLIGEKPFEPIIENLQHLNNYALGGGVEILLDAHGDLAKAKDIETVLQSSRNRLILDPFNMNRVSGEGLDYQTNYLSSFVAFAQYKDGFVDGNKLHSYTLPGEGSFSLEKMVKALKKINYQGFLSFEWEKRWHPELPDATIALPAFIKSYHALDL